MCHSMMEEAKKSTQIRKCLFCTSEQTLVVDIFRNESECIFNLLCRSLKVKLTKKHSWDFETERLPFCSNCLEVSKELVKIEETIKDLNKQFQDKVEHLKVLLIDSETKDISTSTETKGTLKRDERFKVFRKQVINGQKPNSNKKSSYPATDEALSVPIEEENPPIYSLRRSQRSKRSAVTFKGYESNVVCEDDPNTSDIDGDGPNEGKKEESDFENGYIPSTIGVEKADLDEFSFEENSINEEQFDILKSEIKQELPYESEFESQTEANRRKRKKDSSKNQIQPKKKLKTTRKKMVEKIKKAKIRKIKKCDYNDYDIMEDRADMDSDLSWEGPGDPDYSSENDEEMDNKDTSIMRKWKHDKGKGKLWYDGIEVFVIETGYKCSKCDTVAEGPKDYKTRGKMKKHLLVKHIEKYVCLICDKVTSRQKYLDQHIKTVHEKSVIIPCKICGKPFTSINAMRRHAWNHQSEEEKQISIAAGKKQYGNGKLRLLQCGQCGKLCKGPYNLRRHEETHIEVKERQKHMCSICGAIYSAPESLRSHIKLAHENNNQLQWLQCPQCPKKYPQPGRLEKHMRTHTGEKPFICSECGAAFSQPTLLKTHMLKHKNIRPHKCEHCDMAFYRVYHLRRHTQVYHESANPPTKKQPYRSEIGTRKAPQKRERKKIINTNPSTAIQDFETEKSDEAVAPIDIISDNPQQQEHLQQTTQNIETVDSQQILIGSLGEVQQNFGFMPSGNFTYPFATYTFTASGLNSNPHQQE